MQFLALPVRHLLQKRQRSTYELQQILEDCSVKKDRIALSRSLQSLEGEGQIRHKNAVARFGPPKTMVHLIAALQEDLSFRTKVH